MAALCLTRSVYCDRVTTDSTRESLRASEVHPVLPAAPLSLGAVLCELCCLCHCSPEPSAAWWRVFRLQCSVFVMQALTRVFPLSEELLSAFLVKQMCQQHIPSIFLCLRKYFPFNLLELILLNYRLFRHCFCFSLWHFKYCSCSACMVSEEV